ALTTTPRHKLMKECRPVARDERAVGCLAQLAARPAGRSVIEDDHSAISPPGPVACLGELRRVEGPVAPAPDDDDVAHHDATGPRRVVQPPWSRKAPPR